MPACVAASCNYLDICGEPEFMERMEGCITTRQLEGLLWLFRLVGLIQFRPKIGFLFNSRQWESLAEPSRIEALLSLESERRIVGNLGTYDSVVLGVAKMEKSARIEEVSARRAQLAVRNFFFK